jgi:tetratricopeptide (TPR) repeat protein
MRRPALAILFVLSGVARPAGALPLPLPAAPAAAPPAPAPAPVPVASPNPDVRARELFQAGRYAEALDAYGKLHAETRHPTYLRNMGRCHQMMRQPEQAISRFLDYLREARGLDAAERSEIEGYVTEMRGLQAATPAAPAPAAEPAWAPGAAPDATATATSDAGAESRPITSRWWFWTGIGALVVGGVVTAFLLAGDSGGGGLSCPPDTVCPR